MGENALKEAGNGVRVRRTVGVIKEKRKSEIKISTPPVKRGGGK